MNEPRARRRSHKSGRRKKALAPLRHRPQLNLEAPAEQPLSADEVAEAEQHLALLRRFKKALRLSLNAAEDLMVNGARPPDDRGVLKHLLAKVDRQVVQAALSREPFNSDLALRGVFLAGIVRLRPSFETLVAYLETMRDGDRRSAAEAFGLTVQRLSFDEVSSAQLDQLLRLITETFDGHDRTQVWLGLLDRAHGALEQHRADLDPEMVDLIAPLSAAHGAVVRDVPIPESEDGRALIAEGVEQWLAAPANVLRSYPEKLRWRLAEYAVRAAQEVRPDTIPATLFSSLPVEDRRYAQLAMLRAEALARAGQPDAARALLRPVATRPDAPHDLKTLDRVLSWPRFGQATFEPAAGTGRLRRAFELTSGAHGWGRTAPAQAAGALVAEARRQADLLVPGVAVVLGHGLANDGSAYVVVAGRGRPWTLNPAAPIPEVLQLTLDAILIARAVDAVGLTLPDLHPARFLVHGRPARLTLADLSGVAASEPTQAALTHGRRLLGLARSIARDANGELRTDLPPMVAARLVGNTPIPLLVKALVTALGRSDTPRQGQATAPSTDAHEERPSRRRRRRSDGEDATEPRNSDDTKAAKGTRSKRPRNEKPTKPGDQADAPKESRSKTGRGRKGQRSRPERDGAHAKPPRDNAARKPKEAETAGARSAENRSRNEPTRTADAPAGASAENRSRNEPTRTADAPASASAENRSHNEPTRTADAPASASAENRSRNEPTRTADAPASASAESHSRNEPARTADAPASASAENRSRNEPTRTAKAAPANDPENRSRDDAPRAADADPMRAESPSHGEAPKAAVPDPKRAENRSRDDAPRAAEARPEACRKSFAGPPASSGRAGPEAHRTSLARRSARSRVRTGDRRRKSFTRRRVRGRQARKVYARRPPAARLRSLRLRRPDAAADRDGRLVGSGHAAASAAER